MGNDWLGKNAAEKDLWASVEHKLTMSKQCDAISKIIKCSFALL